MNPRNLSLASRSAETTQNRASETSAEPAPATAESSGAMPIPAKPRSRKKLIGVGLMVAALLGSGGYWYAGRAVESTDDAQVDADVVAVPARMGGVVAAVHFEENQRVAEGQLLAELEAAPARARLAQADANYATRAATWRSPMPVCAARTWAHRARWRRSSRPRRTSPMPKRSWMRPR
jgi:multidrug resistance efflux pump